MTSVLLACVKLTFRVGGCDRAVIEKIMLTIDGLDIEVDEGMTVLEAALQNDIYIPHLCYHPQLVPRGACRLCIVDIGNGQLVTSCRTPVEVGMVVKTKSPQIDKVVHPVVELLIADHHSTCRGCLSNGHCELQKIMAHLHIDRRRVRRLRLPGEDLPLVTSNPVFDYDPNKCVFCGICVQTCQEMQGAGFLYPVGRGYNIEVTFYGDESKCDSCRECVARCPVGALLPKKTLVPEA